MAAEPTLAPRTAVPVAAAAALLLVLPGCFLLRGEEERFTPTLSDGSQEAIAQRAREADAAYAAPRTVEKVEGSLDTALSAVSPANGYQGLWQAARACAWLAERHPQTDRRKYYARRGIAIGRESVRVTPQGVEPHFYLALNLGQYSGLLGTAGYVKEMAQEAELAIQRDERFDRAGPHLFLGLLHLRTEGKPFVGFGDFDQALRHLARAVELFPDSGENRVAYAEALIADEMYPQAREQLAAAVAAPAPPEVAERREEWLAKAAELGKRIPGS